MVLAVLLSACFFVVVEAVGFDLVIWRLNHGWPGNFVYSLRIFPFLGCFLLSIPLSVPFSVLLSFLLSGRDLRGQREAR
jgi:hypothetical protein